MKTLALVFLFLLPGCACRQYVSLKDAAIECKDCFYNGGWPMVHEAHFGYIPLDRYWVECVSVPVQDWKQLKPDFRKFLTT